jgi:hypothetical protein
MKPLVKVQIPFSETVAMADSLLAQPPEWFKPFFDGRVPSFDEITKLVDAWSRNGWRTRSGSTSEDILYRSENFCIRDARK